MTRIHAEPQVQIAEDKIVQIPSHFIDLAVVNKLSGTEWALWMYLCRICPFGDLSKGGEKVFKSLPSPAELAITLGRSEKQIARAAKRIEELGLYSFRIDVWRGYNETAVAAKGVLEKLERTKKDASRTKMSKPGQKSLETDKNVPTETRMSEEGQKSLQGGSEPSPANSLQNSHTIHTSKDFEKTTTDGNAAVSFSDSVEEKTSVKKPVGVSEQLLVNPEDCVVPDPLCSVKPNQESCREKANLSASMKSSAPAHVELSRNDTLISEFGTWLSQTGRDSYRKDLVGLSSVMQKADEKVLGDAIAHVKEKIDSIKSSFGGYLRTAIEKQLQPLQAHQPPVVVQETQKRSEAPTLLKKDGFARMSGMELYGRFSEGSLVRSNREISMKSITEAERLLGKKYPRDLMLDMLGNTGSIHPIADYYKSHGLDFSAVEPHLITDYLICESDGLPVVCFRDQKTGQYELVVVTR